MFQAILMDFAWASGLILIAYFLRTKIKVLQNFFIPVSVIAGILGLLLGNQILGKVSPVCLTWSENVGDYANPLLAMLFISQFLTLRISTKRLKKGLLAYLISSVVLCAQVLLAIPIARMFGDPDGLALLPQAGFYGAHGVSGVVAGIYESIGYWNFDDAFSVGNTFATFGMLWGVIVGIILINFGSRKGWLVSGEAGQLSEEERTGYIKKENRSNFMQQITTSTSLDPLAFHVAIVGLVLVLAYGLMALFQKTELLKPLPVTIPGIIIALIIDIIASRSKLGDILDGASLQRVGATALEFLITISLATTNLGVFMKYGKSLVLISIVVLTVTTILVLFLSKSWLHTNWFENAMCMLGAWSGSGATGIMLARVADPEMKTDAMPNYITQTPFSQLSFQTFFLMGAPLMVASAASMNKLIIGTAAALVICLVLGFIFGRNE